MLLHFVAVLLLRDSAGGEPDPCETLVSNKPAVLVTLPEGEDVFAIELEHVVGHAHRIESWEVTNEDGESVSTSPLSYNDIFKFSPSDCDKTSYTVTMTARCAGEDQYVKITLDTITMEPIPIDQMANFDPKDYAQLRGQKVVAGQSATMTCQTSEDANRLYGDNWKPIYVWFQVESFLKEQEKTIFAGPSDSNTLVIDSASCSDAGHYYCKVRRCDYHSTNTTACNNNDLAVQLTTPPPVTTKKCRVFGDPHVITFDGARYYYRGECWYVLALDSLHHKWFIYGWFAPCGTRSSCLETVSIVARTSENPGGTQIQMLRGYAMNIQGEKTFIRRNELKIVNGIELLFTGDHLKLEIPEFGLSFKYDGLTAVTITVDKDTPTLGICGDNDGDKTNDYSSFYDGQERTSDAFVDAWSLGPGACLLSKDLPKAVVEPITTLAQLFKLRANPNYFPTQYIEDFCKRTYVGFNGVDNQLKAVVDQLPQETVDYFIAACVQDTKLIDYGFFDKRYSFAGCTIASMLAEEAEELGMCISEWHAGAKCPTREKIRNEAIRIGCVWTEEDFNIVTS